jgi:hypothetical protein
MDEEQVAPVRWHQKRTIVERRMTVSAGRLSVSVRVDECTMSAVAAEPRAKGMESCAELELGAHVARIHAVRPGARVAGPERPPSSVALVPAW